MFLPKPEPRFWSGSACGPPGVGPPRWSAALTWLGGFSTRARARLRVRLAKHGADRTQALISAYPGTYAYPERGLYENFSMVGEDDVAGAIFQRGASKKFT